MDVTGRKISWKSIAISLSRFFVLYVLVCVFAFAIQRSLLYFPSHHRETSTLKPWLEKGELIGYCRESENPSTIWLMMHGNAGQASDRQYALDRIPPTDSLYVLEYPGYGQRAGSPSQDSFNEAAADAYRTLLGKFPNVPVGVIGESIGSGPASTLASQTPPPAKIILIVPYDSLYNAASGRMFFLPVWLLLLDRWDNVSALKDYRGPLEIYGAVHDDVIPFRHAQNLARQLPQAVFHQLDCGHNDWSTVQSVNIQNSIERQ